MKILKIIEKSFRDFDDGREDLIIKALHFLHLQEKLEVDLDLAREVDFFFYSKKKNNAFNLKSDLEKEGYNVEKVHKLEEKLFSVCGTAFIWSLQEKEFICWVRNMNDFAYINNCDFDGWGMISRIDHGSF